MSDRCLIEEDVTLEKFTTPLNRLHKDYSSYHKLNLRHKVNYHPPIAYCNRPRFSGGFLLLSCNTSLSIS